MSALAVRYRSTPRRSGSHTWSTISTMQHLEVGGYGRLHFGRAPVFADAHHLEAQALEFGNDRGLPAGKVSSLERPFLGELMAKGSADDGFGVA